MNMEIPVGISVYRGIDKFQTISLPLWSTPKTRGTKLLDTKSTVVL